MSHRGIQRDTAVELSHVNFGPNSCTLLLAEILNVVQVFSPAQAVTVCYCCYCCYCCSAVSKQKMPKKPGCNTRKYLDFPGYFRALPALDAGDRRGSLPGLPYCCSVGLTLATVVGEPHCCSVVTVNTSNTVQLLTFDNPTLGRPPLPISLRSLSPILAAIFVPPRGRPLLVVLSLSLLPLRSVRLFF